MIHNIGILTFHASHNYGSMLQAYALQTYLKKLGHSVTIINMRSNQQKKLYEYPSVYAGISLKKLISIALSPVLYHKNQCKWKIFESFINDYLYVTEREYSNFSEIQEDLGSLGFDRLIAGGDQIWNQKCPDFEMSYLLPFESSKICKIAYAPSMGNIVQLMQKEPYKSRIQKYVSQFDVVSVREPESAEYLSQLLNRVVTVEMDPALLLSADDYDRICPKRPLVKGKYLFYYSPKNHWRNKRCFEKIRNFARNKGLKIVSTNASFWQYGVEKLNASGPVEFLNVLKYADFVCGRSFHLGIFSLLYHKDFVLLDGDRELRIKNLLSLCGISERGISMESSSIPVLEPLDYNAIDEKLHTLRGKSTKFLETALCL